MYSDITQFGRVIPLKLKLDPAKLLNEISSFKWSIYNTTKQVPIPRLGLSITHNKKYPLLDLESLLEYNQKNNTNLNDEDFNQFTDVFFKSKEIRDISKEFHSHLARSHILKMQEGGYFPPHRDPVLPTHNLNCFRILVPIYGCNPPTTYFFIDEKLQHWNHGQAYFIDTNMMHHFFSYNESMMIVFNISINDETVNTLIHNMEKI